MAVRRFWRVALAWLGGGGLEALGDYLLLVVECQEACTLGLVHQTPRGSVGLNLSRIPRPPQHSRW